MILIKESVDFMKYWEDFRMGLFLKFGQVVSEIFTFYCSKKRDFFRQDLEETYISGVAP